jgi:diguanylate cyclase (GGDEF)-like protein
MRIDPPIASPDGPRRRRGGVPLSIALFGLVLAAIGASAALTARSLSRLVDAQTAVTNSMLLDGTLKDLLNSLLDTETGQRGYLLTGQPAYLEPYYGGLARVMKSRDALAVALDASPSGAGQLDALNKAIVSTLEELALIISLKSEGRTEEALKHVLTGADKRSMDAARDALRALAEREGRLTRVHLAERAQEVRNTYWVLGASISLNVILLGALLVRMRYAAGQERRAREAMAVGNAELSRLLEAMAVRHEQTHALSELSRFLQSCADTVEAGRVLQQQLPVMMRADSGALYLFAASRNQLRQTFSWGQASFADYLEPGECWGLRLGQPYRQSAEGGAPVCEHLQATRPGAPADRNCLPLVAHGDLMGLLVLESGAAGELRVTAEDEDQRRMTLEQVALSIGNLQLRESLRQQSIRDPLTGLYNRRFLEESVRREVLRASRLQAQGGGSGSMALLMLDIDHFKRFNDQHGHEVGDRVLREVGLVLQRVTRDSDVAARYGGEEFTIVMLDTTPELGLQRAEQIRADVERMAIEALGKVVGEVTISIGLAQFPMHGTTLEALFRAADKALYHAKHTGRNRVVVGT